MNQRQSLKAASKHIQELEDFNARASADIKAYNTIILCMIEGASPCGWCEERAECQLEAKDGKGCSEWWLGYGTQITEGDVKEADKDGAKIDIQGSDAASQVR